MKESQTIEFKRCITENLKYHYIILQTLIFRLFYIIIKYKLLFAEKSTLKLGSSPCHQITPKQQWD